MQNDIMSTATQILGQGQGGARQNININAPGNAGSSQNGGGSTGANSGDSSKPNLKGGAKSLLGRYGMSTVKAMGKGTLRTMSTVTGTVLGFAGGVAKGDISEAFKGAAAGGTLGRGLANGGINLATNAGKNIKNLGNDIKDTWNEGAYGTEYAQDVKMARMYKQTSDYKELKNMYGDRLTDEKLIEILKAAKAEQEK